MSFLFALLTISSLNCHKCGYKYSNNSSSIKYINSSYIITGGNDNILRYWDLTKDGINFINGNNLNDKGSYIINAPNDLTYCNYSKSSFSNFIVLQSNESFDDLGKKTNLPGFSEYQNYNGITYHSSPQNEFEANCFFDGGRGGGFASCYGGI